MTSNSASSLDLHLESGGALRVQALAPHTFRIRLSPDGDFAEPALVRYGVLRRHWPETAVTVTEDGGIHTLDTGEARLTVDGGTGCLSLAGADGDELLRELVAPWGPATAGSTTT